MTEDDEAAGQNAYGIAPPGFRLPPATRVGMVRLLVTHLQRSIEYYEWIIGLQVCDRTRDAAMLGAHGDDRPLVALHTRSGILPARRGSFGLYHFALLVPDRSALGRFAAHLSALNVRVGMADHLVSEALYLWDPDGLGIEVYADRPRREWRRIDREVVMSAIGGYHHHLGTNTWAAGPSARANEARLLDWELVVPSADASRAAARSLRAAGYDVTDGDDGAVTDDPWGTRLRISVSPAAVPGRLSDR